MAKSQAEYIANGTRNRRLKYNQNEEYRLDRLAKNREWKRNNTDKIRINNLNRIARQNQAEGLFTIEDLQLIKEEQANRCPGCLQYFSETLLATVDHFIPLIRGGSNWPSNLQLLCGSCNCRKNDKLWQDWVKLQED